MTKVDALTTRVAELEAENCFLNLRKQVPIALLPHLRIYSKLNLTKASALKMNLKDETGAIVKGEKGWFWKWVNQLNTFISFSPSRGFDTVSDLFPTGFEWSALVSDFWAAQLKVKSKAKQIYTAHLSRELNYFIDSLNDD